MDFFFAMHIEMFCNDLFVTDVIILRVNKNDTKGNASEKEMQSGLHYKNTVCHQVCDGAIQIPQLIVYNGLVFSSKCIH